MPLKGQRAPLFFVARVELRFFFFLFLHFCSFKGTAHLGFPIGDCSDGSSAHPKTLKIKPFIYTTGFTITSVKTELEIKQSL